LPTGAGEMRTLEKHGIEQYAEVKWLPDGKRIVFVGREAGHLLRCYVQQIEAGGPKPITPEGVTCGMVSPDGKSVTAFEKGQGAIYAVDGIEKSRPIPGFDSEAIAGWSSDGKSLYVYPENNFSMKIYRLDIASGRKEFLRDVIPSDTTGIYTQPVILITPDAKSYVYTARRVLMDLYMVEGLK